MTNADMEKRLYCTVDDMGDFFDIFDEDNYMHITDYRLIRHDIFIGCDNIPHTAVYAERHRDLITSIELLRSYLISHIMERALEWFPVEGMRHMSNAEKNMVAEQIILDLLFEKYLRESEKMTPSQYAKYTARLWPENMLPIHKADANRKKLERSAKQYSDMIHYSKLREEVRELGVDPDKYADFLEKVRGKRPKYMYDILSWNRNPLISRQYRRQLTREGRNYPYWEMIRDMKDYNNLVNSILPSDNEAPKDYFRKAMDYYALESYRRIDFMMKLAGLMQKTGRSEMGRLAFITRRFTPHVLLLDEGMHGELVHRTHTNYYRPSWTMDDMVLNQIAVGDEESISNAAIQWQNCVIVRAKIYELFKYHAEYVSTDYEEIQQFLKNSYPVCDYHRNHDAWKMIMEQEDEKSSDTEKTQVSKEVKDFLTKFISVNELLFWPSEKRSIHLPQNENQ